MPSLFTRQNPLDDVRNTFSSWDSCMAKAYCKWPVIVGIVVGSLILLSVVTCIARCICCGAECACCCFRCCSCCCSGSGGGRSGHKRMKSESAPTYPTYAAPVANPYAAAAPAPPMGARPMNQQYQSNAMPTFTPAPAPERPQFATFASKPVNEDALPAMPTWNDGRDVHVEVEEPPVPEKQGDMELDRLDHNGSVTNGLTGMDAVPSGGVRRSPGPGRSPIQRSPTGDGYQNGSFVGAGQQRNSPGPYGRPYAEQGDYRRGSPGPNLSPVYVAGEDYAHSQQYGRHSPGQQQAYDQYHQHDQYDRHDEPGQRYRSPAPSTNAYSHGANNAAPYDSYAPAQQRSNTPVYSNVAPQPQRSNTPGYPASESTRYEPSMNPTSAYPGQRSYSPQAAYPGQQAYQAFQPAASQGPHYSGVTRKAVDGSYREI